MITQTIDVGLIICYQILVASMMADLARVLVVASLLGVVMAAEPNGSQAPLFEDDAPIALQLRGPLSRAYEQHRQQQASEVAGQLIYDTAEGQPVTLSVKFRQRGNIRRIACALPPLRLNLARKELAGTLFDGQDKLKLVGVCEAGRDYRRYLMLEYFAYRAYALLTPRSFDTRLLDMRYVDTDGGASMRRPAFVIEDVDALAARNGMRELGVPAVSPDELDPDATALLELFQLMIGNTDFSTTRGPDGDDCCHNVKLIAGEGAAIVPVPYDFDSAGIVDTPYALPSEQLPIDSTRTRLFRGLCKPPVHFERARERMLEREDAIIAVFDDRRALGNAMRGDVIRYLRYFFAMLKNPALFERDVLAACVAVGEAG